MLLQAGLSSVFFEGATLGDVSFWHAKHTIRFGEKSGVVLLFSQRKYVLFAQKRRLIETFLLSTQNIRFGEKLVRIGVFLLFS